MGAATRVAPASAQVIAAGERTRAPGGHERGADQYRGIGAPYLLRRAIVEQRHEPGMHAGDAVNPRRRHVAFAERELDIVRYAGPFRSHPSAWAAARETSRRAACRRWSHRECGASVCPRASARRAWE